MNKLKLIKEKQNRVEELKEQIKEIQNEISELEVNADEESRIDFAEKYKEVIPILEEIVPQYIKARSILNEITDNDLPLCIKDCVGNIENTACKICLYVTHDIGIEEILIEIDKKSKNNV